MSTKTIRVSEETYHKVAKLGNLAETFDSVLDRIATEALEGKIGPEVVRRGSVPVQTQINNGEVITGSYAVIDTPDRTEKTGNVTFKGTPNNNSVFSKPKMDR